MRVGRKHKFKLFSILCSSSFTFSGWCKTDVNFNIAVSEQYQECKVNIFLFKESLIQEGNRLFPFSSLIIQSFLFSYMQE